MFDYMDFGIETETVDLPSGPMIPEAIDCMRCGVCLSRCPTYQLTHDEQESPRQRIRSLSRLLREQQTLDNSSLEHLQNCLQCRACEAVCPSKMTYAELYDQAQVLLAAGKKHRLYARLALALMARKHLFNALLPLVKCYQLSGLQRLLRKLRILDLIGLSRADKIAPQPVLSALKSRYPVPLARGTVALFTGCVGDRFDRETLVSAITVLNRIGYSVRIPKQQVCCGAIHYHNGAQTAAEQLMRKNIEAFSVGSVDAIIYCATGCGSQLQDYQRLLNLPQNQVRFFQDKLYEISEFVEQHWPASLTLNRHEKKVRVHEPCSQRNVLKNESAVYQLLNRVSGLDVTELPDNQLCCGAGGSYMLTHPQTAEALRDMKWQHLQENPADYLVTANIGCALHLASADAANKTTEILHPITLIARLLC